MKKLLAVIMCLLLTASCIPAYAMPASAMDEGLAVYPSEMTLPMYSSDFGDRLWVFWDGEQVPASYFTWSSSNTSVLTVTQSGVISPVAPGVAAVTVSDGNDTAQCTVTVVDDEGFTMIDDLQFTDLNLPFYSDEVGIGPLCGAEPVILKRFIVPPSCSGPDCDQPDPDAILPETGWEYTYAVIYRFMANYEHTYVFSTEALSGEGAAQSAYVAVYDQFFNLWVYSKGTTQNPFGSVTLNSYEDSYFYVVITPVSHTADGASGCVRFSAYDVAQPYAPVGLLGDTDCNDAVNFADVAMLYQYVLGAAQLTDQGVLNADVDGTDGVSFADVSSLYSRIISG